MYKQHCANLKQLESAIDLVKLDLRRYISMEMEQNEFVYTKVLAHLITCWTEVRVLKLTYELDAFTSDEIDAILHVSDLKGRWVKALNIAVCKAYKVSINDDSDRIASQLPFTARARYNEMLRMINQDLFESIQLRNRIAHGQWLFAFTNDLKSISTDLTRDLRKDNILKLQYKREVFKTLTDIIHDLAVSKATFERDFDLNYRKIEDQYRDLRTRSYEKYKQKMIEKFKRGKEKKTA